MAQTTARVKKGGKHFEILVDMDEALKVKKGEGNINAAVLTGAIFYNLKAGEHASEGDLDKEFGTSDVTAIAEKIIKEGEIVRTAESMKGEHEKMYKQVVDFLSRNAVSPEGRPYTPDRIMQVNEIMDQLSKVLPVKIEMKKVKLMIPAIHTGKAYGIVKEFMIKEDWKNNGDLEVVVEMPTALIFDFYDKINGATHGSIMSEELKA